jgi:hypothetical protein
MVFVPEYAARERPLLIRAFAAFQENLLRNYSFLFPGGGCPVASGASAVSCVRVQISHGHSRFEALAVPSGRIPRARRVKNGYLSTESEVDFTAAPVTF